MIKLSAIVFGLGTLFAGCLVYGLIAVGIEADSATVALITFYALTAICGFWYEFEEAEKADRRHS